MRLAILGTGNVAQTLPDGSVVDLGGITSARGTEHYFLMFAAIMPALHTRDFNIRLIAGTS